MTTIRVIGIDLGKNTFHLVAMIIQVAKSSERS